jgi:hypothetical protein
MSASGGEEPIATIKNAGGIILAVSENRAWIEVLFEGDLMHTKTVNLPADTTFDIYVEDIPHKISRDGAQVIVRGGAQNQTEKLV